MAHLPIVFTDLAPAQSLRALLLGLGPVYDPGQAPPLLVLVHSVPYFYLELSVKDLLDCFSPLWKCLE